MTSLHDLLSMINQAKQDLIDLDARIAARRGEVEEMAGRFHQLGVDGTAARLHAAQRELDEARGLRSQIATSLEEASRLAVMAISGTCGVATRGAPAEAGDFEPSTPTPSGDELPGEVDMKRRGEGLAGFFGRQAENVNDVLESAGKQIDIAWSSVGHDPTPSTGLRTGTETSRGPVIQPAPEKLPKSGSLLVAGFLIATIVVKSTQDASSAIRKSPKVEEDER